MDQTCGEPSHDLALEEEFRLWRAALAEHGHALPGFQPTAGRTPSSSGQAVGPALPAIADQTDHPSAGERVDSQRRTWPALIFVAALVLAVTATGYWAHGVRRTIVIRPSVISAAPLPSALTPPYPAPPDDTDRRRAEMADNITHAGEALALSGDAAGALRLYRQSLSIRQELATRSPGGPVMQQALADGWDKVADMLAAQADTTRALEAYREAEAVWERCAHTLPNDRDVQRNWSLTALSLGNLCLAHSDPAGAVQALNRGVSIQEALCRQEPDNAPWQEDLALGWLRLSDAYGQWADDEEALRACRHASAIDEALLTRDPTNLAWQGDLATAHGKAGDLLLARNEADLALQEYTVAAAGWEKLSAADANPERRRAVAEARDRIGQALETKKQPAAALPFYQQALDAIANLVTERPADQSLEGLQAVVYFHLGRATADCQPANLRTARAALREARDRLTNLESADGNPLSKEQAATLTDVERLLAELEK